MGQEDGEFDGKGFQVLAGQEDGEFDWKCFEVSVGQEDGDLMAEVCR